MSNDVSDALRRLVQERAWHVCEYCLVHERDLFHGCEVDHVRSMKHRGLTTEDNLAFACLLCNRHKGTDLGSVSELSGGLVRFYNPRSDRWSEHFHWNDARIEPVTEIGEVTTLVLQFNHAERVAFRRFLSRAGRYPSIEAMALLRG